MKAKTLCFLGVLLVFPLLILAQQKSCSMVLRNTKTNKTIEVCNSYNPDKIEAILGKAISLDKQVYDKEEEPIYTFVYDGLQFEMQNNKIKLVTITTKNWKLNGFTIGTLLDDIMTKHESLKKIYAAEYNFKVTNTKGCLFVDTDPLKKVKRLGVIFL